MPLLRRERVDHDQPTVVLARIEVAARRYGLEVTNATSAGPPTGLDIETKPNNPAIHQSINPSSPSSGAERNLEHIGLFTWPADFFL